MVSDADKLIDRYTSKILANIDKQNPDIDWNYVNKLGETISNSYDDIRNEADSRGRNLRRIALGTFILLLFASIGVLIYYKEHDVDMGKIITELVIVFVLVAILQFLYYFLVSKHYKPSKLNISHAFINRIKYHL
jgi:hypothetical protein